VSLFYQSSYQSSAIPCNGTSRFSETGTLLIHQQVKDTSKPNPPAIAMSRTSRHPLLKSNQQQSD
jgi:hypothetical protein